MSRELRAVRTAASCRLQAASLMINEKSIREVPRSKPIRFPETL
jgi:hypothetical protein